MLPLAVPRSFIDDNAIRYVLPVLRMFCRLRQVAAAGAKSSVSDCIQLVLIWLYNETSKARN